MVDLSSYSEVSYALAPIIIPLIYAGTALTASALQYFGQKKANKTNEELAKKANETSLSIYQQDKEFQENMWQKNTRYNDPRAQMERLERAGVNPALAFGSGSFSQAQAPSVVTKPPTIQKANVVNEMADLMSPVMSALSLYQNIKQSDAQIDAINENRKLTEQKVVNEALRSKLIDTDTKKKVLDLNLNSILFDTQIESKKADLARRKLEIQKLGYDVENIQPLQRDFLDAKVMRQQFENQFEGGLKEYGVRGSDNVWLRMILTNILNGKIKF